MSLPLPVTSDEPLRAGHLLIGLMSILTIAACRVPREVRDIKQLIEEEKVDEAQKKLKTALEQAPTDETLLTLGIDLDLKQGNVQAAVNRYRLAAKDGKAQKLLLHLAIAILRWGLHHRDSEVRLAALQGARKTDADSLESDVAARLTDPVPQIRAWAAVAMSQTPAGADALDEMLRSSNSKARAIAVGNLGRIAGQSAFPTLRRFVKDRAPIVRSALARSLAYIQDEMVLDALKTLLKDRNQNVRTEAARALGTLEFRQAMQMLLPALEDPYLGARLAAVLALAKIANQEAKPYLLPLANSEDLLTALRAGVALAKMGDPQPVLNAIAKGLVDRQWSVRAAACNATNSVKDHVAYEIARRALSDPEPLVRIAAARTAYAHGDRTHTEKTALSIAHLACNDSGRLMESLCLQSAELLTKIGYSTGPGLLKKLSLNASPTYRILALNALLDLTSKWDALVELLDDPAPTVSIAAAIRLYQKLKS